MMMMMLNVFLSFSFSSRSLKKKTKRGVRGFRTAAAPVLANLSSPLDEACLFECVVYFKKRERERKKERLWFDSEEDEDKRTKRERKSQAKKFLFRRLFLFSTCVSFKIPNALTH